MRVETVQHCLDGQQIADCQMNRGALGHSNEWAGNLKRSALLRECVNSHARTRFGLRVPVSSSQFEVERQNSLLQSPICGFVGVRPDEDRGVARGLCNQSNSHPNSE